MTLIRKHAFPVLVTIAVTSMMFLIMENNYFATKTHRPVARDKSQETTIASTAEVIHGDDDGDASEDEEDEVTDETEDEVEEYIPMVPVNVDDPRCPLRYTPPPKRGIPPQKGAPFAVDSRILKQLDLPFKTFVSLDKNTVQDFVFATGASHNHRFEVMDGIASIQHFFPGRRIVFYDLGMRTRSIHNFQMYCGVTVRHFNFTEFPPHVRDLKRYAWKPLIIQELLHDFGGVFWLDASIRLRSNDLTQVYAKLLETDGILQFKDVAHSNFAVTNPKSYEYFPTNIEKQKTTAQSIATTLMLFRTEAAYWNILHWWFLCSLDRECISPVTVKFCDFKEHGDKWNLYVGCHRFDQAIMSLLNSNHFGFDNTLYTLSNEARYDVLSINRTKTNYHELKKCGVMYHPVLE